MMAYEQDHAGVVVVVSRPWPRPIRAREYVVALSMLILFFAMFPLWYPWGMVAGMVVCALVGATTSGLEVRRATCTVNARAVTVVYGARLRSETREALVAELREVALARDARPPTLRLATNEAVIAIVGQVHDLEVLRDLVEDARATHARREGHEAPGSSAHAADRARIRALVARVGA